MLKALLLAIVLIKPPLIPPEILCVRTVDGDTIVVEDDAGKRTSVRLLGIDAPETKHPTKGVQPYGPEASAHVRRLLTGRRVRLVDDTASGERDRYGRRLAWVFLDDACVNEELVSLGLARAYTEFRVDPVMEVKLQLLERKAREAKRGLWSLDPD